MKVQLLMTLITKEKVNGFLDIEDYDNVEEYIYDERFITMLNVNILDIHGSIKHYDKCIINVNHIVYSGENNKRNKKTKIYDLNDSKYIEEK